jgi:hypothetical protein
MEREIKTEKMGRIVKYVRKFLGIEGRVIDM